MLEQTRVNDEVWLPRQLTAKIDVKLALLKNYDVQMDQAFHDYKKFRTTSKIVGIGEAKELEEEQPANQSQEAPRH